MHLDFSCLSYCDVCVHTTNLSVCLPGASLLLQDNLRIEVAAWDANNKQVGVRAFQLSFFRPTLIDLRSDLRFSGINSLTIVSSGEGLRVWMLCLVWMWVFACSVAAVCEVCGWRVLLTGRATQWSLLLAQHKRHVLCGWLPGCCAGGIKVSCAAGQQVVLDNFEVYLHGDSAQ